MHRQGFPHLLGRSRPARSLHVAHLERDDRSAMTAPFREKCQITSRLLHFEEPKAFLFSCVPLF